MTNDKWENIIIKKLILNDIDKLQFIEKEVKNMDMYQKRKKRQEKNNSESNQESFPKVSIS